MMPTIPESPDERIRPSTAVIAFARAGELVLLDMGGGRRVTLDAYGAAVWRALADAPTRDELRRRLRTDPASSGAPEDVLRPLLARWRDIGLVIP